MSEENNSSAEKEFEAKTETMSRADLMLAEHKVQTGISDELPGGAKVSDVQKSLRDLQAKQEQELRDRSEERRKKRNEKSKTPVNEPVDSKTAFLNEKLDVTVAENGAVIATPLVEKSETSTESGDDQEVENDLPKDLPGRKHFLAAGIVSLEKVATFDIDALKGIPGIGDAMAEKVLAYGKTPPSE
jgi:hypothetical protein